MTSPSTQAPSALVLVLHGYGSDAAGMGWLTQELADALPHAAVLAIDGPEPAPGGGRRWFDIAGVPDGGRGPRARAAVPAVGRQVADALGTVGLDHASLALVGFSQGATMALQYAASAEAPPRAVVALSGRLAGQIDMPVSDRPAVLLGHGTADPVIRVGEMAEAARRLTAVGFDVATTAEAGLGHAISPAQVDDTVRFLRATLPDGSPTQQGV